MENKMLKKIVNENNSVNFGSYSEQLELNFQDYQLPNFFNKLKSKKKTIKQLKKFSFLAISSDKYLIGIALVKTHLAGNIFVYAYEKDKGMIFEDSFNVFGKNALTYSGDNFNCEIKYQRKNKQVHTTKKQNGEITLNFNFENKLICNAVAIIPKDYQRLIVANPADFSYWTFTEKMQAIPLQSIQVKLDNQIIIDEASNSMMASDWSAGFFHPETNWLWAACGGKIGNDKIGFNFAIFNNDALYPEKCVWINNKKYVFDRILFDVNYLNPQSQPIHIYDNDKTVDLYFTIDAVEPQVKNYFNAIKMNFKQYVGFFNGTIKVDGKTYKLNNLIGLFEVHKSVW